jgi:hypothetical protein
MAIYIVGQSNLRIELETDVDVSSATNLIKYRDPEGTTGSFSATPSTGDTSKIYYDVSSSTVISIAGKWLFWAHSTFGDGSIGKGATASITFRKEGDV